jgi:hypothetical protein
MQADEFVREYDAERLAISGDAGASTWVLSLRAVSQRSRSKKNSFGLNSISKKRNSGSMRGPAGSMYR